MKRYVKSDVKLTFNPDEMNNPDSINFRDMINSRQKAKDEKEAAEALEAKRAELKQKYSGLFNEVESTDDYEKKLEVLNDALVPPTGQAETPAGELIRATEKLLYRNYNDGDVFFAGYGKETCGSAAAFIGDKCEEAGNIIQNVADNSELYFENDEKYNEAMTNVMQAVVDYVVSHPELVAEVNNEDMLQYVDDDYWNDYEPKFDFDVNYIDRIEEHVDADHISWSDFEDWLNQIIDYNINSPEAYLEVWYQGSYVIKDLVAEDLYEFENEFDRWLNEYANELDDEYGVPGEDEEDEEYDEEDEEYDEED